MSSMSKSNRHWFFRMCCLPKNSLSTELLPFRYFVLVPTIFWLGLHLLEPIQNVEEIFKGLWISTLGGVICGSILWLFYAIFRRGHVH